MSLRPFGRLTPYSILTIAALTIAFLASAIRPQGVQTVSADIDQAPSCSWESGARLTQSLHYMASAYDTDNDVLYLFGGLNKDNAVQNFMQAIDFAGAAGPGDGKTSTKRNGPARIFGASAFYRPSPDVGMKGTIYVLFGSKDPDGPSTQIAVGEDTVYAYDIETNSWSPVSTDGVTMGERVFAAAEYDPVNDIAVVTGGVKSCETSMGRGCDADAFETLYLTFDEDGDITAARGPSGGPRTIHGHSMVYDTMNGRMLVHGGTTNGETATDTTWALDMVDPAAASWSRAGSGGPDLVGHSAAYWPGNEWLVVHGGASNAPFRTRENVSTKTHGLAFDPAGDAWVDLDATTRPTERMGASAEYVDNGTWKGVVVVGGRARFNADGSSVASEYTVLQCGIGPAPGDPPTPTPRPTRDPSGDLEPLACPGIDIHVPPAVIAASIVGHTNVGGWGELCNPSLPPSAWNGTRRYLSLRNPSAPYHPLFNSLVYKCGCP